MNYFIIAFGVILVFLYLLNKQNTHNKKADTKFSVFSKDAKQEHKKHQAESGVLIFWAIVIPIPLTM
ncbi:hypothetical protein [Thalassotalea piscium]|uniref:Dolichol kinase n=1 Tax=Thalassotalea piscium TaxID=1230533 RepID=A0A7X0NFI3_9GAMM|nr:hypothetical protein [Thalassotalea piscium]MBB6542523.1 dolichol kinase [Thalassotalea piscium]